MRLQMLLLATATAAMTAGAAQAASVAVKDAVARVTVIPEDRTDIRVEVIASSGRLPLQIRMLGDRVIVDGDLDRKIRNCRGHGEGVRVHVRGVGDIGWQDMPQVAIHTPRDVKIETGGAVFGAVGRSANLSLGNAGCGDWTVANVKGAAKISMAGSGDTRMGSAGDARIHIVGSGDVATGDIRGSLAAKVAGSGSVFVKSIEGPLDVNIAGSGDVVVGGGRATAMTVSVAGSGSVDFRGTADSLKARVAGSGDIHALEVKGEISKSIAGSGSIHIGG